MKGRRTWRRFAPVLAAMVSLTLPALAWAETHAPAGQTAVNATSAARTAALARAAQVYAEPSPLSPAPSPTVAATATSGPSTKTRPRWNIGFAKESLDPRDFELKSGNFHLGGYGLFPTRASTGPLIDGDGSVENIYARAMAISNHRGQTLLLAAIENQGTFAAYKQGAYGIWDMRQKIAADLNQKFHAQITPDMIVINSDHSHAGPDLIGLWGGVPVSYLQYNFDQTVKAVEEAYANEVPAELLVGVNEPFMPDPATGGYVPGTATPGEQFDHSQFNQDTGLQHYNSSAPNTGTNYRDDLVNTQLRVLQAVGANGARLGSFINYAAHATVMGGGNKRYSADWPGRVARATEIALGEPVAVTMVADVGRTQPPRPHSDPQCNTAGHITCDVDQLDTWTRLFTPWVLDAVGHAQAVTGTEIANKEIFTHEVATNGALLGVSYTGEVPVRGYGAYRSTTPPWISGDVVGTFASAHRVGNLLLSANPGEAYPDIRFAVGKELKGYQYFFTFGLANDQLGYLIAPASEYPWIFYSNFGNDNAFFNVSAQYGDHLYCTETALGAAIGFDRTNAPEPYGPNAVSPNCSVSAATDPLPMEPATQQPWPFGDGVALPPAPISP